jgi:hypothetical protein
VLDHHQTFRDLHTLVGLWHGISAAGRALTVTYSLHAKASVLMEHWHLSETTDALTLYHMDGDTLMATHYCPLCNQPRLNLADSTDGELGFEFASATNLANIDDAHQHSFQLRLIDEQTFWRSETYVGGVGGFEEAVRYQRITPPTAPNP